MRHERGDMPKLGGIRFQKFAPCRNGIKEIGDADGRSSGKTCGLHAEQLAVCEFYARSFSLSGVAGFK